MSSHSSALISKPQRRLLSIDVDDLLIANADFFDEPLLPDYNTNIEHELISALDLLQECGVHATFFVNAQYCAGHSDALREIVTRGHSVASHGYRHKNIGALSPDDFERDLGLSIEQLSWLGAEIIGYRPPAFSMPYDDYHLKVLSKHGIRYVSSGVGVARSNAPKSNDPVVIPHGLMHVPISTVHIPVVGVKYAIGYGVTSRLMPERVYLRSVREWLKRRDYFHWYCHTFELSGLSDSFTIPYRGLSARISTAIYAFRCRGRREFMKSIIKSADFDSIENSLFPDASRP